MENWEFLLQRKGDKSWLPLESPTVEILEGAYRLAARSALANTLVAIAIAYRPLADVRHPPIQQKIVKRISHDGLLIVMPYTNLVPGLWQIDCLAAEPDTTSINASPAWKKTVKFDVIQISSEAGAEWQYSDPEEDLEDPIEIANDIHVNALGIIQTEPTPLSYSSPILDIAEQRSTELVRSMFEEFAIFNDDDEPDSEDHGSEIETEREIRGDRPNLLEQVETYSLDISEETSAPLQPRILLRLKQPQYVVSADNSFHLTGDVYTQGEIEVSLKDPQTLDIVVNQRFAIATSRDRNPVTGAIPFSYQILVPPPSEIQVLIGEVQIHSQQDSQRDHDLFMTQQAIAVSYPASRVLPELIKEAQKYSATENVQNNSQINSQTSQSSINHDSYPQSPQSYPQVSEPTNSPSPKSNSANSLSLPPLPSNKPQTLNESALQPQPIKNLLSLPPLPPLKNKASNQAFELSNVTLPEEDFQSFPQANLGADIDNPKKIELELTLTDINTEEEPELLYSFEEELPQNYEELLEQPYFESSQVASNQPAYLNDQRSRNLGNRFLNKLQTLSADAIAAQKANQRTEELLLDTFPNDPLTAAQDASGDATNASIDLDNPDQMPLTIAESASFAELDLELDVELDRLLSSEPDLPDLILNEYVWEESVDPNTFPISTASIYNSGASALSETAQTIRNIQESSPQALSEQEPIPIPEIIIPSGEIVSGTPMLVTVRLPALTPKFFVKFWIKDLQTRMIVDGPRWLLDFSTVANAEFIETRTNISIPLSSIDVAFEAIAIEAQTQRESHKVRITRAVTPPNLAQDSDFSQ